MRAHFNQIRIMALCLSLLAALAPALASCGLPCTAMFGQPPHVVLTVKNGMVYGVSAPKFFAIRASDGKMLWQNSENPYNTDGHLDPQQLYYWSSPVAPVVDGQTVIETMGVGLFAALRATDGKMLWHSQPLAGLAPPTYGPLSQPPVVADGVIYTAVGYGAIAAWSEGDGHTLWVSQIVPDAEAAPSVTNPVYRGLPRLVVAGSTVYTSVGRSVFALRTLDGSALWHLSDAPVGTSYSAPLVAANTVYVADSYGVMTAIDANTGAIRWRTPGNSPIGYLSSPSRVVVNGRTVYVTSHGSLVQALNVATGTPLWRFVTHTADGYFGGPLAPLVVAGGRVYLASLDWGLFVLDAATGRELWRATLDNSIFNTAGGTQATVQSIAVPAGTVYLAQPSQPDLSTPAVDQGAVVMATANGAETWDALNGQQLWVRIVPNKEDSALVQSIAVAGGAVYLAQGGTQATCGFSGLPARALALRETDGAKRWQVSI